jgi:hypothetical protein
MSVFLSVENMKYLIQIISTVFKDKYSQDVTKLNVKNIFLTIMKRLDEDPENANLSILEKNKLTLKVVKEILKTKITNNNHTNNLNRDSQVYPERKTVFSELHSEVPSLSVNTDVSERMKVVEDLRLKENVKEVKKFEDINSTIEDQCLQEEEFKNKMKQMENDRIVMDDKLKKLFPQSDKQPEFVEQRNKDMSSILNKKMEDIDPTAFFKKSHTLNAKLEADQNIVPASYKNLAMSTIIPRDSDKSNYRLEKKFVLINSYDRNWVVDKYRYKYKVRFAYNTNSVLKVPYYANNPTIPHTKTEKSPGINNDYGWVDKNGIFHPAYDPLLIGNTEELGYEEVEIVTDQDASMIGTFKDIYSIQITNVTIPTEIFNIFVNSSTNLNYSPNKEYNYNFNFPYILCNIDEFQDVYDGTDDTIRKTFCQLQFHEFIKTPSGRGYIILKPVQQELKIFYPNSLSTLPTLNISLTKPNGELLNNNEDGLTILKIEQNQTYYFKIITKIYFDKDSFYSGDYIRIKNFNLYQIEQEYLVPGNTLPSNKNPLYNSEADVANFISFINRQEGHVINEIGDANDNGYYNHFYIFAPGELDKEHGRFKVDDKIMKTLANFNDSLTKNNFYTKIDTTPSKSNEYENGHIINMSLQNSISMTIEMYKPDSKIMKNDKL